MSQIGWPCGVPGDAHKVLTVEFNLRAGAHLTAAPRLRNGVASVQSYDDILQSAWRANTECNLIVTVLSAAL